jgi:FecR-like protein/putative zinc finger protein
VTMFMNHVTHNLSAYIHSELSAESAKAVEAHLAECEICRKALEEIRFGDRLASTLRQVEAPESIWNEIHSASRMRNASIQTRPNRLFAFGCAFASVVIFAWFLRSHSPAPSPEGLPSWEVASIRGTPRIGRTQLTGTGRLRPGESLQTDAQSEAEVHIADVGQLDLDPNSRIRLISTNSDQHRIALERGRMTARTWSPPRLFVVDTPSSTAVDLGCIYTCEVQHDGSTLLHVTLGLVALDFHGRETVVPAGAYCRTRPGGGVGTPYFDDSSEQLKTALNYVDFGSDETRRAEQLEIVLREARPRDTLTLWYLIPRLREPLRAVTVDRLETLVPLPRSATRSGVMTLNAVMMDAWKSELERVW